MDATDKAIKLTRWLTAAERGEITFSKVKENLMEDGLTEPEADEIVGIAQGETDLIMERHGWDKLRQDALENPEKYAFSEEELAVIEDETGARSLRDK